MSRRKRSAILHQPEVTHVKGWTRSPDARIAQLEQELRALSAANDRRGVAASYVATKRFAPQALDRTIDVLQDGGVTTQPVNVVVPAGITHTLPIVMSGPGVFLLRTIRVDIRQRVFHPTFGPMSLQIPGKGFGVVNGASTLESQTVKWSILHNVALDGNIFARDTGLLDGQLFGANWFWNISDSKSGRRLADDLLPHGLLLPRSSYNNVSGGFFNLPAPWFVKRDGQLQFQFRVINPILQLAPTATVNAFDSFDDREQSGAVRNQEVTLRVEFHGDRFTDEQDFERYHRSMR